MNNLVKKILNFVTDIKFTIGISVGFILLYFITKFYIIPNALISGGF